MKTETLPIVRALRSQNSKLRHEAADIIEELVAHIADHARFAETRIQDGKEMGAAVWRIALEDMAGESRELLAKVSQ